MTLLPPLLAFMLLAAGTYRQSQFLFGAAPPTWARRALLAAGYTCLLLSFPYRGADASLRVVRWFGDLSLAALVVVGALWLGGLRAARGTTPVSAAGRRLRPWASRSRFYRRARRDTLDAARPRG